MKKRIKITKKLIKESLDETTLPPKGANSGGREPTQKMGPFTKTSTYDVPKDIRDQIQQMLNVSKQDPTQKIPITDRVINWFKSLFAPEAKTYSDEEVEAMSKLASHSKETQPKKQISDKTEDQFPKPAKLPDGEQLSMFDEEPFEVDPKDDESLQKSLKDKEEIDLDMYRFQEAKKKYLKKEKEDLKVGFDDLIQEIKQRHFK